MPDIIVDGGSAVGIRNQVNSNVSILNSRSRQGMLLGAIGDSRVIQAVTDSGQAIAFRSWPYWFTALSRGRARFDPSLLSGLTGDTTAQCLVRLPALITSVLAAGGDGIVWLAGTNDPGNSILPDVTAANVQTGIDLIKAAGLLAFIIVETPRGAAAAETPEYPQPGVYPLGYATPASEPLLGYQHQIMEAQRRFRSQSGVYVIDATKSLVNHTTSNGIPRTGLFYDGLHLGAGASKIIGEAFARLMETLVPEPPVLISSSGEISKTGNIWGNLLFNGMVQGTAATPGTNTSGVLADSWNSSSNDANFTGTLSKVTSTNADGSTDTWQQIVVGGGAAPTVATPQITLTHSSTTAGPIPDGCILEAAIEIEVDAGASRIQSIGLVLNGGGSDYTTMGSLPGALFGDMPATAWSGVLITPRLLVPSGGLSGRSINFVITGRQGYAGSATIRIRRATFRRVT